jgi:uncharacterized alpha-E superfamily protein
MSRYIERAENIARFLDVANRMAMSAEGDRDAYWQPVLSITGGEDAYTERCGKLSAVAVVGFAVLDSANSASIYASLRAARENAHAVRSVIPHELWESVNATWLEARGLDGARLRDIGLMGFCDWVRERSHLFRGITYGTMMRDEPLHFIHLGTHLERADNTARLLEVRGEGVGVGPAPTEVDPTDQLHWAAVLRSVSAFKAFRTYYRDDLTPLRVADMLIMRADMPRSLHACLENVVNALEKVGPNAECTRVAGGLHAQLHWGRLDQLLNKGLDKFVEEFLVDINALGARIHDDFLMA